MLRQYQAYQFKAELDHSCRVVFPVDCKETQYNSKNLPDPDSYSKHMGFAVYVMASLVRSGQIKSYKALWYLAREFRLTAPSHVPSMRNVDGNYYDEFGLPRFENIIAEGGEIKNPGYQLVTALNNQFESFRPGFLQSNQKTTKGPSPYLNVVVRQDLELTRCFVDIEGEPLLFHTPSKNLSKVLKIIENEYYSELGFTEGAVEEPEIIRDTLLFPLFWWAAHACFDLRGSAAKSDACLRALHLAVLDKPLPAWLPGFVPDLKAMSCYDANDFVPKIKEGLAYPT